MSGIINHCKYCTHSDVCKFKDKTEEVTNALLEALNTQYPENIVCKYYKPPRLRSLDTNLQCACNGEDVKRTCSNF